MVSIQPNVCMQTLGFSASHGQSLSLSNRSTTRAQRFHKIFDTPFLKPEPPLNLFLETGQRLRNSPSMVIKAMVSGGLAAGAMCALLCGGGSLAWVGVACVVGAAVGLACVAVVSFLVVSKLTSKLPGETAKKQAEQIKGYKNQLQNRANTIKRINLCTILPGKLMEFCRSKKVGLTNMIENINQLDGLWKKKQRLLLLETAVGDIEYTLKLNEFYKKKNLLRFFDDKRFEQCAGDLLKLDRNLPSVLSLCSRKKWSNALDSLSEKDLIDWQILLSLQQVYQKFSEKFVDFKQAIHQLKGNFFFISFGFFLGKCAEEYIFLTGFRCLKKNISWLLDKVSGKLKLNFLNKKALKVRNTIEQIVITDEHTKQYVEGLATLMLVHGIEYPIQLFVAMGNLNMLKELEVIGITMIDFLNKENLWRVGPDERDMFLSEFLGMLKNF